MTYGQLSLAGASVIFLAAFVGYHLKVRAEVVSGTLADLGLLLARCPGTRRR